MAKINWTPEQANAIQSRGGTLLVSAAAGSGKTAVLSQRVIERIADPQNPVDIDRMLIVTYTKAAAEQMRSKISSKLQKLLEPVPDDVDLEYDDAPRPNEAVLKRQQILLGRAHISTIHSFCFDLIKQHVQKLPLSPDISIADDSELGNLREEALKQCVEEYYSSERGDEFTELADLISSGRDDRNLFETVYKLYDFIRSHPFYEDWLTEKLAMYDSTVNVCDTVWGEIILTYTADSLDYCAEILKEAIGLICENEKMTAAYENTFKTDLDNVKQILELAARKSHSAEDWDIIAFQLSAAKELTPLGGRVMGEKDNPAKQRVDAIRKEVKSILEKLADRLFSATAAEFTDDIAALRPQIELLFALTLSFAARLDALKRERRLVDFSDLEHFALALLYDEPQKGVHLKSSLAREVSQRSFDEIMIDEYQDTNEAQNMIFSALARSDENGREQNLFLVGDVKQSIYRFRQAMPEIFMQKKREYSSYDGRKFPAKINLGANFRSRTGVTDSVNFLFLQLMSEKLGELDYNAEEALLPRADYPDTDEIATEIQIIDTAESSTDDTKIVLEARYVARRIAEMITEGYQVYDSEEKALRPVRQSDFCVLLRSKKDKLGTFVKELQENGVNAWAEVQGGYLASREISLILSFLRVLDNPLLDVPLTAIMLSELFAFTPDEVAQVRLINRRRPLYLCVCAAAEQGDAKCIALTEVIKKFSAAAVTEPIDQLILRIYRETDYLSIVTAMPMGDNRKANLRLLAEYAAGYDKAGHKGLCGFVRFVDRVTQRGADFTPAGTLGESANVVRVMTIHRSKGLEFPVVFLCDTAKRHNAADYTMARTILHPKLGFACRRRDPALMKEFTTVPMEALKLEGERSALSEELRVLYVAMTRAKEKLIITMTQDKRLDGTLKALSGGIADAERIPSYLVRKCKSFADWILMCALRHPDGAPLRGKIALDDSRVLWVNSRLCVQFSQPLAPSNGQVCERVSITAEPVPSVVDEIRERAGFVYPYTAATVVPAKLGVSSIAHRESNKNFRFNRIPKFLAKKELTGAQRGLALHQFMQFADYAAASIDAVAEINRVTQLGFITEIQRECIDVKRVQRFFGSALYRRIAASGDVRRELRFLSQLPANEIGFDGAGSSDTITVQGVADCVFIEDGACVIVDYKTDTVKDAQELVERYSAQLTLYKKIIEESLHLPVKQCVLYSFALSTEIPLVL
ncbi:helicase-exonuclease AddAB subunit AddA [Hydrogenoanaerobacterium sp.]|uniref:helicase-exonuclease AddAB subunit AddA n=1 Tax=Hydrogenoanaerobacterium sp. TaxID=2953763 RepID=UPI002898417A|nr:helicase-exonuclease AddAB subunit AddA [Hydrogenoanaerobacterium sp.]